MVGRDDAVMAGGRHIRKGRGLGPARLRRRRHAVADVNIIHDGMADQLIGEDTCRVGALRMGLAMWMRADAGWRRLAETLGGGLAGALGGWLGAAAGAGARGRGEGFEAGGMAGTVADAGGAGGAAGAASSEAAAVTALAGVGGGARTSRGGGSRACGRSA